VTAQADIVRLVTEDGCYVGRKVFTDPDVYSAEKRMIFGKSWLFLAHESQLPDLGDFITTTMAETPVIVARGADGAIYAHANSCSHRGLPVCRADFGNTKGFVCPYRAWTYSVAGELLAVPQERRVGRIDKSRLGLPPVPRVETYRGFVFGSFAPQIESLADYLGDMRFYIDVYLDRFPAGVEVIGPPHKWLLSANWKLPYENQLGDLGHGAYLHGALAGPNEAFSEAETYGLGMVRALKPNAWAENPPPRTRRFVMNVEIESLAGDQLRVFSNFQLFHSQHGRPDYMFAGQRRDRLEWADESFRIAEREVILDGDIIRGASVALLF
jgi:phenylpropionate dioxygenase-like ring-hydroxylating dioxygenase large terminal subunit